MLGVLAVTAGLIGGIYVLRRRRVQRPDAVIANQQDDLAPNPPIQRTDSNTVVAAAVAAPSENSVSAVPTARAVGIRTQETVDANLTLPPALPVGMGAIPVAQTQLAVAATLPPRT